jgi:hypothetical protein
VFAPDDGWKYHPKYVEQFPDINKLCNFASCWIYEYIGILLGARPVLHISSIKVKHNKIYNDIFKNTCIFIQCSGLHIYNNFLTFTLLFTPESCRCYTCLCDGKTV